MTVTIPCRRQYWAVKDKGHPSIVTFLPNHTAHEYPDQTNSPPPTRDCRDRFERPGAIALDLGTVVSKIIYDSSR